MEFKKGNGISATDIEDGYKNRIFKGTNEGLFGILKKDLSNYTGNGAGNWTKRELKQVKIDFIRQCGYARGVSKNKEINGKESAADLKITGPTITFIQKDSGGSLVPEDEVAFNY